VRERECGRAPNVVGTDLVGLLPRRQGASGFDDCKITANAVQHLFEADGRHHRQMGTCHRQLQQPGSGLYDRTTQGIFRLTRRGNHRPRIGIELEALANGRHPLLLGVEPPHLH
jgi:hypothetical protein